MANTFRKIYKKTGNSGNDSDYELIANVGVNGIDLDIMKGATSSADGEIGLVPKPTTGQQSYLLSGDGSWKDPSSIIKSTGLIKNNLTTTSSGSILDAYQGKVLNDKITSVSKTLKGATSSADGEIGLVPKPTAGKQNYVLTGSASWKDALSLLPLVRGSMTLLNYCKMNYVQRGVATTKNLNGYFRSVRVTFSVSYKSGTTPGVSVSVVNYQNTTTSARVHPLVGGVTNRYFDIYVADEQGLIGGSSSENAFSVYWIAIGEIS